MIAFLHSDKLKSLREFMLTKKYVSILFVITVILSNLEFEGFSNFNFNVVCCVLLAGVIAITLVLCEDLFTTFAPFMLICLVGAKCYDSFSVFIKLWPFGIFLAACLLFHFIVYKKPYKTEGFMTTPMIMVGIATALGGVGFISAKEYFALSSLYHIGALGFGMLFIYWLLKSQFTVRKDYSITDKLTEAMVIAGCFACVMLAIYQLLNINFIIDNHELQYLQWRNNYSTILMLAMPFAFYYGHKEPYSIIFGFVFYFGILLTGSRGGLVFGAIELCICCIVYILFDKKRRLTYIAICLILAFAILIFSKEFFSVIGSTLDRLLTAINGVLVGGEKEQRYYQYQRGIQDFLGNPIFGTGIGYTGNRDIYANKEFGVGWYHCAPIQIAASFGGVGIIAYITQFVYRIVLLFKKPSMFSMTVFLSYISLELMSLVNPGIFAPIPYLFLITMFLAIVENCNGDMSKSRINFKLDKLLKHRSKRINFKPDEDEVEQEELVTK